MSRLPLLLFSLALAAPIQAQCDLTWLPGAPVNGPDGDVEAVLPLPNGDLLAAGSFLNADSVRANCIARWDGTTWHGLGSGADNQVMCLARLPNGDIVAGGWFTAMGGVACSRVARWNGTAWTPLGTGFDGAVQALVVLPTGDLVAGGNFAHAGAANVGCVARWNGTAWSALGSGLVGGYVRRLAVLPSGELFAGGQALGTTAADALFSWNGTTWQVVPGLSVLTSSSVQDLAVLANGTLAVGGSLVINSQFESLALWNGTALQPLTAPINSSVRALFGAANGDLLLGGAAATTPPGQPNLARWNGTVWTPVAGAPSGIRAIAEDGSARLVVGTAAVSPAPRPSCVSRFDGTQWQRLGAPLPPLPQAMVRMPNGDVVVGGAFTSFRGVAANNLVRWNGSSWQPLGLGVDGPVRSMALAPNGDLVVSGTFQNAGGAPASCIARWNGSVWSTLGAGLTSEALALAVLPTGEIFASAPTLGLRSFSGGQWSVITIPISYTGPQALAVLPNGSLAMGGLFNGGGTTLTGVVLYNGGIVTTIPNAPVFVSRMFVGEDGTLFVSGSQGVRSWDGTTWTQVLSGTALSFAQLPNGELLVGGGASVLGATTSGLHRLTPSGWINVGEVGAAQSAVTCIAVSGRGEILAGGTFATVDGLVSSAFTQAQPTCPAGVQFIGSGCSGGAGPVTLAASNLPWTGGTFRADATGMTANSLALQLLGVQPASGPLPGGAPGCSLFVNPVVADVLLPAGGAAHAAFVLPNQPSLAGLTFRLQVVGIELGTAGIVRLTSSNALEATIGVL